MIAVDTSSLIEYLSGGKGLDVDAVETALEHKQAVLPPVVLSELLSDPTLSPDVAGVLTGQSVTTDTSGSFRLAGLAGWDVVLSSVVEVLGEETGVAELRRIAASPEAEAVDGLRAAAEGFLAGVERRGFLPRQLFFGAQRFRRWSRLNADATLHAQASTLHELYETYGLARLHATYPETRARFYRETVFREAGPALADGLETIIARLRARDLQPEDLSTAVSDLLAALKLSPAENLIYAARLYGLDAGFARREIVRILGRLGIAESRLGRPLEQMSRGMQQKVAIARAFLTSPVLLLLDEPTTGLDPRSKLEVQAFIEEIRDQHDATIVLTTHDLEEAIYLGDRVIVLGGSPAGIMETMEIDLPRPRNQLTTREDGRFLAYRHRLFEMLVHECSPQAFQSKGQH